MPSPEGGPGCFDPEEGAVGVGELEKGGGSASSYGMGSSHQNPGSTLYLEIWKHYAVYM
jgi:hypothetical protein